MAIKGFDLMKELQKKIKENHFVLEGAMIAFKTPDNETGTLTLTEDLGVRLRLLQEAHIQEKIMNKQEDDMISKMYFSPQLQKSEKEKKEASYFG